MTMAAKLSALNMIIARTFTGLSFSLSSRSEADDKHSVKADCGCSTTHESVPEMTDEQYQLQGRSNDVYLSNWNRAGDLKGVGTRFGDECDVVLRESLLDEHL